MPLNSQRRRELVKLLPEGALITRSGLEKHNITKHAIDNLIKSRQLESVKNGVYKRDGSLVEWGDIIYFLQQELSTDLVIGGLSALELQTPAYYPSETEYRQLDLYGTGKLPLWVNGQITNIQFKKKDSSKLFGSLPDTDSSKILNGFTKTISWKHTNKGLRISVPERALLEILNDVPGQISFDHAFELMLELIALSPVSLQSLLEICNNIKVKRLFFLFAEQINHRWLAQIDRTNISLGSGNRSIIKRGKLDKKYLITVPETYE